ncbi:MAG: hypothetical protein NCW75_07195 [Phycisphaera sp.]|nr:MAG: hypothetical protein NCW75_07195 [Phycisphaera sp.]
MASADSRFEHEPLVSEDEFREAPAARRGERGPRHARRAGLGGLVLAGVGAVAYFTLIGGNEPLGSLSYFYDESAQELFVSRSQQYPPIEGIDSGDSDASDGVQAVLYTCCDSCNDGTPQIAYLQRYTDEAKQVFERADAAIAEGRAGPPEAADRKYVSANTLVRRVADPTWHPKPSREGQDIAGILLSKCPGGVFPRRTDPTD